MNSLITILDSDSLYTAAARIQELVDHAKEAAPSSPLTVNTDDVKALEYAYKTMNALAAQIDVYHAERELKEDGLE